MDALRTLEILLSSRTPLIAIETLEEERVAQHLRILSSRILGRLLGWLRAASSEGSSTRGAVSTRAPAVYDLVALAEASDGFSGAEIGQAVVSALHTAFARGAELATEHILEEIKATKPLSVTRAEEVDSLREWARGRAVPAA
jgi:hypothetical protein